MEEAQKKTLCEQLGIINTSIFFNLLVIFAVLSSFWTVLVQRGQVACTLAGNTEAAEAAPPIYPVKRGAAVLFVGALGFFLCLALHLQRQADAGEDCVAKRSANTNVWASLLVLLAAVLRLDDLDYAERAGQSAAAPEEDVLLA